MSAFVGSHAVMLSGGMEYTQFLTLTLAELTIVVAAAKSINKDDDNILDNPTKLEDIEIVHQINAKALNKVFDAYIEDKIKHHKIVEKDFEEKGSNNISIQ